MPQDYILRLLQQLGAIVATIAGKRASGDLEGAERTIADECERHTGLPFVVVKRSGPAELSQLLAMGGSMQVHRALILAELLRQDAEISATRGNPWAAVQSFQQVTRLIDDVLPYLAGEEKAAFLAAQADVAARLRDLGGA